MGQYDECYFCKMGKYNRALAFRIIKNLSREDMKLILRWNLIEEVLKKKGKLNKSRQKRGGISTEK